MADSTQRGRSFQWCQRLSHSLLHHLLDEKLVPESRFQLGGMDVHIDRVAGEIEKQEQRRPVAGGDRRAVAGLGGAQDERITNGTASDKHIALPPCRASL